MITDHDIINRILENQQRCVDQVVNVHEKILTYLQEDRRRSSNNNQYQRTSEGSNIHKRSHVNMQLEEQEFERLSKASKERNQDNRLSAGSKRNCKDCDHVKDNDKVYTPPIQSNRNRIYPNKRLFDVQNRQEQPIKRVRFEQSALEKAEIEYKLVKTGKSRCPILVSNKKKIGIRDQSSLNKWIHRILSEYTDIDMSPQANYFYGIEGIPRAGDNHDFTQEAFCSQSRRGCQVRLKLEYIHGESVYKLYRRGIHNHDLQTFGFLRNDESHHIFPEIKSEPI